LATVGCGVNEKNWAKRSAKVSCKFAERCATSNFYFNYDSMGACIDDTVSAFDELELDYAAHACTFDKKQAKSCLKAMRTGCKKAGKEYDSLFAACQDVWACATPIDTGTE
jgi:hypothetical protein